MQQVICFNPHHEVLFVCEKIGLEPTPVVAHSLDEAIRAVSNWAAAHKRNFLHEVVQDVCSFFLRNPNPVPRRLLILTDDFFSCVAPSTTVEKWPVLAGQLVASHLGEGFLVLFITSHNDLCTSEQLGKFYESGIDAVRFLSELRSDGQNLEETRRALEGYWNRLENIGRVRSHERGLAMLRFGVAFLLIPIVYHLTQQLCGWLFPVMGKGLRATLSTSSAWFYLFVAVVISAIAYLSQIRWGVYSKSKSIMRQAYNSVMVWLSRNQGDPSFRNETLYVLLVVIIPLIMLAAIFCLRLEAFVKWIAP